METEDRRLLEAAQADPRLFVGIYDRYFHRVWAYVIRRTPTRADAEEVTSDVFQHAFEGLKAFEWRGAPLFAWLRQIAANELADRWRKQARMSSDPPPDVEEPLEDLEQRAALFQLVDRLPAEQRSVIEMRFLEAKNIAEVAAAIGKSEGAVKQLQRRAIHTLRMQWEGGDA